MRRIVAVVGSIALVTSLGLAAPVASQENDDVELRTGALTQPATAAAARPKKTECATNDPAWVRDGIKVMQSLGPASKPGVMGPEFFSMEIAPEITGPVDMNPGGYQRLWDMGVAWKDVNPAPSVFDWSVLDQRVRQAEAAGAKPMYVLGLTPQWAAADPNKGDPRWGLGTASAPSYLNTWLIYVREVANRYNGTNGHGRIHAFEVWNEANITTFWDNGNENSADPFGMGVLAQMTKIAYDEIKAANPEAVVVAATTTTRVRGQNDFFGGPQSRYWYYLRALKEVGYPFDAWGIHSYPAGNAGPTQRMEDVTCWQEVVVRHFGEDEVRNQVEAFNNGKDSALSRPIFDTELNFGLAGPGPIPSASYTGDLADRLIWRAYIDSARLGIDSTTWYLYSAGPYSIGGVEMGVQMYDGMSTVGSYRRARAVLMPNRSGKFLGCGNIGAGLPPVPNVNTCRFEGLQDFVSDLSDQVVFTEKMPSNFIMFSENVFGIAVPTVPFIASGYQSLTPPKDVGINKQVQWADGRPVFIAGPRAANRDLVTKVPQGAALTNARFTKKEMTFSWKAPENFVTSYTYTAFYCPPAQASGFKPRCDVRQTGTIPGDRTEATIRTGPRSPGGAMLIRVIPENQMGEGPATEKRFRYSD